MRGGKGSAQKNKGSRLKKKKNTKGSKRRSRMDSDEPKEKRKIRYHPGTVALREIKRYQKHAKPLTAKSPFDRRVRNVIKAWDPEFRLRPASLEAMREATEAYLVEILSDSNLCAFHAGRQTVMLKDIVLAYRIRGGDSRAYY